MKLTCTKTDNLYNEMRITFIFCTVVHVKEEKSSFDVKGDTGLGCTFIIYHGDVDTSLKIWSPF